MNDEAAQGTELGLNDGICRRGVTAGVWFLAPVVRILACSSLVSIGAHVRVPLPNTDVPMTLQGLAVLISGLVLTPGPSVAAMLLYLASGAVGLPVFTPQSLGLLGPSGGYLVGFVIAAPLVSVIAGGRTVGFARFLAACAIGQAAIFLMGVGWRTMTSGGDFVLAISTGFLPFVPKAVLIAFLAATTVACVRRGSRW
jgi:biotin transport system substrate-specific component